MRDSRLRRWLAILVFFVVPFGPTVTLAQESRAGVVTTVEGQALLARPTLSQPVGLKFKDDLFARDRIETKEDSIVRVLLGGKAVVTIRELSVFTVTEEPGRAAVDLRSGKLALGVAKSLLRPGEVIEIRTPNAVAGIRGSLLVAEVAEVGGVPQSAFTALQATVPISIATLANPNLTVSLSPNQMVSVSGVGAAAAVGPVLNITPAQAQRAAATAAAPRQAGQATTSLLDSQMTTTQVAQAAELASLIAPASQSMLTTAGVVSVEPTPSTAQLGVNETEAGEETAAAAGPPPPPPPPPLSFPLIIDGQGLNLTDSLLNAVDGNFATTGQNPLVSVLNGGSLTTSGTGAPLFQFTGTAAGRSTVTAGGNFLELAITTPGAPAPSMTLSGPLLNATLTQFKNGDPTANVQSLLFVGDGATVIGASPSPFLSFDGSSVDTSGNIVSIRRSPSTSAPSVLFLLGPLLSAVNGSSFNTSSLGLGAGCCSVVSVTQGGFLFATTASPLVHISGSTVNAGPDAQSGGSIISLSDTFTNAPPAELVAPAIVSLAGPLLSVDNSTVTALFHLLRVGNSDLISSSPDPLMRISGSTVTLGGTDPFTHATSAARLLNLSMSNSDTPASLWLSGPLLSAVNSTLSSTAELFGIFGGTLTTTGTTTPLISLDGGTVTSGAHLIHVSGLSSGVSVPSDVELSDPLLSVTGTTINARGNLVRIAEGASLSSSTTSPLIGFQGGSYTGGPFNSVTGASLLRMFSQVGQSGTSLSLAGPYLAAADATFISPDAPPFNIADGAVITSTGAEPFASFTRSSATTQSSFFNLDNNTSFGSPPTVGSGESPSVSIAGTLIKGTDTTFTTQNFGTFLRLNDGVSLTQAGTSSPLVDLVGSSPESVVLRADGSFAVLSATAGRSAPTLSITGPLLNAVNSTLTMTNDVILVLNGASLTSTTSLPLLQFGNTALTAGTASISAQVLQVNNLGGPGGAVPASVTLNGPLLVASSGSSLNLTGGLFAAFNGGQATVIGSSAPFVSLTGGTHSIASNAGTAMFRLFGRSTATAVDLETGLTLGTDKPLQQGGVLLETSGATVTGQRVVTIDTALLEATAPLLNLKAGSVMTSSVDAINLNNRANVSLSGSDLVRLDASVLNVSNGALARVAGGSKLTVGGNLVNLLNGATLTVFNGPLITVSGSSFVNITGSLISFGGTGGNKVNITNSLCPCSIIGGVPVALQNGALAANVQITNPIKNAGLGQLNLSSENAALAVVNGANTKLKVSGQ